MATRPLGNPQSGYADPNNPHPPVYHEGKIIGYLSICSHCSGYYWAECPCMGWYPVSTNLPESAGWLESLYELVNWFGNNKTSKRRKNQN